MFSYLKTDMLLIHRLSCSADAMEAIESITYKATRIIERVIKLLEITNNTSMKKYITEKVFI